MPIDQYLSDPKVWDAFQRADKLKEAVRNGERNFSDVKDGEGNQYVDLVQQGGGVLGVALVGYTMVLEKAGIRFFNIAGASAGGINSVMLAAKGPPNEERSEALLELLNNKDLAEIVDGKAPIPSIVDTLIRGKGLSGVNWSSIIWNPMDTLDAIFGGITERFGINPGANFHNWIKAELGSVASLGALRERISIEGIGIVHEGTPLEEDPRLALITAELNTRSKVEFPAMADLFWANPEQVHPADFVRATMAIPMFFEPFEVTGVPHANWPNEAWAERLWYRGRVPETARFVDGGMVSNFPIDIFHRSDGRPPRKPTLGARLTSTRGERNTVENLSDYTGALLSTMRHDSDVQYLIDHPELRELICDIEAGDVANWLNFYMESEEKLALFRVGAQRAIDFLEGFDWEAHKGRREKGMH